MVQLKARVSVRGKRKTVTYQSISEAAEATGMKFITLRQRVMLLGWPLSRALTTPVREYRKAV